MRLSLSLSRYTALSLPLLFFILALIIVPAFQLLSAPQDGTQKIGTIKKKITERMLTGFAQTNIKY